MIKNKSQVKQDSLTKTEPLINQPAEQNISPVFTQIHLNQDITLGRPYSPSSKVQSMGETEGVVASVVGEGVVGSSSAQVTSVLMKISSRSMPPSSPSLLPSNTICMNESRQWEINVYII